MLNPDFYLQPTEQLARALLGKTLSVCASSDSPDKKVGGTIVETEAYLAAGDPASHSARGQSARNASMFLPAGHVYVYLIYGMHHCINVVSNVEDTGDAVLIRALKPATGIETMMSNTGKTNELDLCRGPGKLCKALGIDRRFDGASLFSSALTIGETSAADSLQQHPIVSGPRIGITIATELNLRFFYADCPYVSAPRSR